LRTALWFATQPLTETILREVIARKTSRLYWSRASPSKHKGPRATKGLSEDT
jgi:hypothetical protein